MFQIRNLNNLRPFLNRPVGPGGWFKTTVVAFLFMCDFSIYRRRAGKKVKEVESEKSAAGRIVVW